MLDLFPLHIFPTGSLSSSVIPVVWVGMMVVCFFNLRLGWVLTGLVVPGYVVPLILIKPWAAAVILLESISTYFLVWFFSEFLSRWASWNNFFGRDRFFALVLCSIFIRLLFDGWLLPELGQWVNRTLQINFDYRNHLHSFGLIIVALIANQFWKSGLVKGIGPFFVVMLISLILVRYGLMELTNFNLSNIGYLYEDMASSILATPKAYIILISTAFLASRMNLHYGWDFNGILIPSLLALQWYQPVKILATMVETGVILLLVQSLLKMPWLKNSTIEGARKLLLFFNVGFIYKIALGYAMVAWFPEVKVTDYFGFGYLLATLMAVKIHDKAILARLTRATLQTSLSSVLFASVIGYTLTLLPVSDYFIETQLNQQERSKAIQHYQEPLSSVLQREEISLYQAKANADFALPLAHELEIFSQAIKLLQSFIKDHDGNKLIEAGKYLDQVNYYLDIVEQRYLYLHEKEPFMGWGIYVLDMQKVDALSISIPAPLDERGTFDSGLVLFNHLNSSTLAISGNSREIAAALNADVLQNKHTFFHQFHRLVNRNNSLQIRGYNQQLLRQIAGVRLESDSQMSSLKSILWGKQALPESLNLPLLKQLTNDFKIDWTEAPFKNQQRQESEFGFSELILTQQAMRHLLFKKVLLKQTVNYVVKDLRIDGYLQEWILSSKQQIASKGSELYQPPRLEELLFMDEQVVTPLIKLVDSYQSSSGWTKKNEEDLKVISRTADVLGYQVIHYRQQGALKEYLILIEKNPETLRYWGTYVFRLGDAQDYLLQIPRPLYEVNSFEYGVNLFERLNAKVLMISTTHPYANLDGSADITAIINKSNIFNLVSQVVLREYKGIGMQVVSSRAFSYKLDQPPPEADVLIAMSDGIVEPEQIDGMAEQLLTSIKRSGLSVQLIDGSEQTRGYEVGSVSQAQYIKATENKNFIVLWLSPIARSIYRQQDENFWLVAQLDSVTLKPNEQSLLTYVQQTGFSRASSSLIELKKLTLKYADSPDVLRLQQIVNYAGRQQFQLKSLIDPGSKQAYLLILDRNKKLLAIANLVPGINDSKILYQHQDINQQITHFIEHRYAWLESGGHGEAL